jgi:hypothetical protein
MRIGSSALLDASRNMISFHESLVALNERCSVWPKIVEYSEYLENYPALLDALSRLHSESLLDFERGLFCSWVSLMVGSHLGLSDKRLRALYISGLAQDIGNYETDINATSYLKKLKHRFGLGASQEGITSLRERQQAHALVSSSMIESAIPDDSHIAELVLHHHADEDGMGYPRNVGEAQLSQDMQILVVANRLCDRMQDSGGYEELFASIPTLKLASAMYFTRVNGAYYELLHAAKKSLPWSEESLVNRERLTKQGAIIKKLTDASVQLSAELIHFEHVNSVRLIRLKVKRLDLFRNESGLQYNLDQGACADEMQLCMDALPEFLGSWQGLLKDAQKRLPASHTESVLLVKNILQEALEVLHKPKPFSLFV